MKLLFGLIGSIFFSWVALAENSLDKLQREAQFLIAECAAPSVQNAKAAKTRVKSNNVKDVLPQNYVIM